MERSAFSITYDYTFALDTLSGTYYRDRYTLEAGISISRFFSEYSEICDSVLLRSKKTATGGVAPPDSWLKADELASYEDVFFNYPEPGMLTVSAKISNIEYYYEEPIESLQWEIGNDHTTILGYSCQSAAVHFRGREWTVWFSPEIPLDLGPWKFRGLPGAILKATDENGLFVYEAIGISNAKADEQICIHLAPRANRAKMTRKDYLEIQKKQWQDPIGLSNAQGITVMGMDQAGQLNERKPGDVVLPYRPPLELE